MSPTNLRDMKNLESSAPECLESDRAAGCRTYEEAACCGAALSCASFLAAYGLTAKRPLSRGDSANEE